MIGPKPKTGKYNMQCPFCIHNLDDIEKDSKGLDGNVCEKFKVIPENITYGRVKCKEFEINENLIEYIKRKGFDKILLEK